MLFHSIPFHFEAQTCGEIKTIISPVNGIAFFFHLKITVADYANPKNFSNALTL